MRTFLIAFALLLSPCDALASWLEAIPFDASLVSGKWKASHRTVYSHEWGGIVSSFPRDAYPVDRIWIVDSTVWIGTFRSDYFQATPREENGSLVVDRVRFLYSPAKEPRIDAAESVRGYRENVKRVELKLLRNSDGSHSLRLWIFAKGLGAKPVEEIEFSRTSTE
ncbi:MAG: hypothetical protein KatS3mg082_3247 [Nitrospiraceae bacterium]|nr:MAG: hypothetical protein KatS3mg082_3247 [Nitrospiraceae bacterium]